MPKNKRKIIRRLYLLLLPITIFYYEVIFNLFTINTIFSRKIIYILLFSVVWGGIGTWFCSFITRRGPHKVVKLFLMLLSSIPFLIESFVYKQFKIFYDLHTITAGAGDVINGFMDQIVEMLVSVEGIVIIILFLFPTLLYAFWLQRYDPVKYRKKHHRLIIFLSLIVVFLITLIGIGFDPASRSVYGKQYNFQEAVSNFGLLTGIRKDIQKDVLNLGGDEFEEVSSENVVIEEEPEPVEIVYDYNEMDIDFTALAAGTAGTLQSLDNYVASLTPSKQNEYTGIFEGKNLIFITAEAFTAEVINPELTPTLYRLATKGINFTDYYQPASAGTTGGEYQNLFGMLPMYGGSSFKMTASYNNYFVIGNQLSRLGYSGWAFHNNSYTYYNRHETHNNLGYSNGFMGYGNGMEAYVTEQWPQSDLEMVEGTLPLYLNSEQPFNVYYMSVSGHSGYSYNGNAMTRKNWSSVESLPYSDQVKGYLAANLELENALSYMVNALEEAGIADDTVIVISTDHFPYGIDENGSLGNMPYLSELYGYNVTDYFQRDHNRLIIWSGSLEENDPIIVGTPTFSLDILPTLSNLFGTEFDSRLMPGRDVFSDAMPLVFNTSYDWKTDLGTYYASSGTFVPVDANAEIPENYVENISTIVRNKINYCDGVLETNYFAHVVSGIK